MSVYCIKSVTDEPINHNGILTHPYLKPQSKQIRQPRRQRYPLENVLVNIDFVQCYKTMEVLNKTTRYFA